MDSRMKTLVKNRTTRIKDAGAHMYHAADAVVGGGEVSKEKAHKVRKALHKFRLRASGMSDNIFGSKEVGGRFENDFEETPSGINSKR